MKSFLLLHLFPPRLKTSTLRRLLQTEQGPGSDALILPNALVLKLTGSFTGSVSSEEGGGRAQKGRFLPGTAGE